MATDQDAARGPGRGGHEPELTTCSKCGMTAMAFICDEPGCPVNGGAAYPWSSAPAAPAPGAEAVAEIAAAVAPVERVLGEIYRARDAFKDPLGSPETVLLVSTEASLRLKREASLTRDELQALCDLARLARHGAAAGPGLAGAVPQRFLRDVEKLCNSVLGNAYLGKEDEEELAHTVRDEAGDLDAALAEGAGCGWRPIETAPRDGSYVLGFGPHEDRGSYVDTIHWWHGRWTITWMTGYGAPTHWQLLPAPPRARQDGGGDA